MFISSTSTYQHDILDLMVMILTKAPVREMLIQ